MNRTEFMAMVMSLLDDVAEASILREQNEYLDAELEREREKVKSLLEKLERVRRGAQ